jgi:transposase InsO family protein
VRDKDEREAVFWCGLPRPLIFKEIPAGQAALWLRQTAAQEIVFPDGRRRKPSLSTLKRKLRLYRQGGFGALPKKRRRDLGVPRAVPAEVLRTAVEAKREQPRRAPALLNLLLEQRHGKTPARSTLYRHLKAAGATRAQMGLLQEPVRKRWTREHTHDLWVGDFSDGPCVLLAGLATPTHLSAFIDAHSRFVVAARYYLRESMDVLCDTLIRALAAHGSPLALYLDNAKVYHAHSLRVLCARLHIQLLHRPAGDPAPGGLIERFIQTAQNQFESEVRAGERLALERLNQAFQAWLDVAYHESVHSETGQTPRERHRCGLLAPRLQQTALESASLLRLLVQTFNEKPRTGKDRLFAQILAKTRAADRVTLLLIDEAHLLSETALVDPRLLLCAGLDETPRLRLLLCGQDGLLHTLARQSLADLLNRVTVRVHLAPLTKDQSACYLDHRLKLAGGSDKLLGDDAKARLHDYAGGVPRLLNNLATLCLIQGAAKKQKLINAALVDEAARELRML